MEDEEKTRHKGAGNAEREGRTQVAVGVEIPKRRETSTNPITRGEGKGDLRIRDTKAARETVGLEASKHTTTDG